MICLPWNPCLSKYSMFLWVKFSHSQETTDFIHPSCNQGKMWSLWSLHRYLIIQICCERRCILSYDSFVWMACTIRTKGHSFLLWSNTAFKLSFQKSINRSHKFEYCCWIRTSWKRSQYYCTLNCFLRKMLKSLYSCRTKIS